MKNLALVFKTNSKSTMTITLANPRDDVTLDEVKAAAAKMIPVLVTSAGGGCDGPGKSHCNHHL